MGSCRRWAGPAGLHQFTNRRAGSPAVGCGALEGAGACQEERMLEQRPRVWICLVPSFGQSPRQPWLWPDSAACAGCPAGAGLCCCVKSPGVWRGQGPGRPEVLGSAVVEPAAATLGRLSAAPGLSVPPLLPRWPGRRDRDLHHIPHRVCEDAAAAGREVPPSPLQRHR